MFVFVLVVVVVAVVVVGWMSVCTQPFLSVIQMGNMEVEEVIERHVATLLMQDQAWISASAEFDSFFLPFPSSHHRLQGNVADEAAQYRRAHARELGHAHPFSGGMVEWPP